jgi:hypothetical protein
MRMYLVRPPRFDGRDMPVEDEEVVHGLSRLRQFPRGNWEMDPSTGLRHGALQVCAE